MAQAATAKVLDFREINRAKRIALHNAARKAGLNPDADWFCFLPYDIQNLASRGILPKACLHAARFFGIPVVKIKDSDCYTLAGSPARDVAARAVAHPDVFVWYNIRTRTDTVDTGIYRHGVGLLRESLVVAIGQDGYVEKLRDLCYHHSRFWHSLRIRHASREDRVSIEACFHKDLGDSKEELEETLRSSIFEGDSVRIRRTGRFNKYFFNSARTNTLTLGELSNFIVEGLPPS
jgi:hypothetical protein